MEKTMRQRGGAKRGWRPAGGGFTLVEVLLAAVILGIIMLSIIQLITLALYSQDASKRQHALVQKAQQLLDQVTAYSTGSSMVAAHPSLQPYAVNAIWPTCYDTAQGSTWDCWNTADANHRWPPTAKYYNPEFDYDPMCNCYAVWGVRPAVGSPTQFSVVTMVVFPAQKQVMVRPKVIIGVASRDLNW